MKSCTSVILCFAVYQFNNPNLNIFLIIAQYSAPLHIYAKRSVGKSDVIQETQEIFLIFPKVSRLSRFTKEASGTTGLPNKRNPTATIYHPLCQPRTIPGLWRRTLHATTLHAALNAYDQSAAHGIGFLIPDNDFAVVVAHSKKL